MVRKSVATIGGGGGSGGGAVKVRNMLRKQ